MSQSLGYFELRHKTLLKVDMEAVTVLVSGRIIPSGHSDQRCSITCERAAAQVLPEDAASSHLGSQGDPVPFTPCPYDIQRGQIGTILLRRSRVRSRL